MATFNFGATAKASDDAAKQDLELICDTCGKHLCDVEHGDSQRVLADVTADHYTDKHDGRGNFELAEEAAARRNVNESTEDAPSGRSFNDHSNDIGDWCGWSMCRVTKAYDDDRCPVGCRASRIVDADGNEED